MELLFKVVGGPSMSMQQQIWQEVAAKYDMLVYEELWKPNPANVSLSQG